MTVEQAKAAGYQVFEGTVHVCDGEELVELQGIDIDPALAGNGGTYAVLAFDSAVEVTGEQSDGSGKDTRLSEMLGIAEYTEYSSFVDEYGDLDACVAHDGQHVTIAALADNIRFPSDVRLPLGEPSASEIIWLS